MSVELCQKPTLLKKIQKTDLQIWKSHTRLTCSFLFEQQ